MVIKEKYASAKKGNDMHVQYFRKTNEKLLSFYQVIGPPKETSKQTNKQLNQQTNK